MRRTGRRFGPCGITALALATACPIGAQVVDFAGTLNAHGQPAEGTHAFRFTPYASRIGTEPVAAAIVVPQVAVVDGRFKTTLDLGGASGSNEEIWLAVEVAGADGDYTALPAREHVEVVNGDGACWDTAGNVLAPGEFIGSTNNQPVELRVNNQRAMRIESAQGWGFDAPNVVEGASNNQIVGSVGSVIGGGGGLENGSPVPNVIDRMINATIGGGLRNHVGIDGIGGDFGTIGGGVANLVGGDSSTVGGGFDNQAVGFRATVGGGISNYSGGTDSTIAGGNDNIASGTRSTVPGGEKNMAVGIGSFAAGTGAKANFDRMFVWSGRLSGQTFNPARNTINPDGFSNGWNFPAGSFNAFADGGVWFVTGIAADGSGIGPYLNGGSGSWSSNSSRTVKTAFDDIDSDAVLAAVLALPLSYWRYETEPASVRHLGPMAEDFSTAFSLGPDDTSIGTVDADGVALAAIQGLNSRLQDELAGLRSANAELLERLQRLEFAIGARHPEAADAP